MPCWIPEPPTTSLTRQAAERVGIDLNGSGVKAGGGSHGVGARIVRDWIVPIDAFRVGTETIHHSLVSVIDGDLRMGNDADAIKAYQQALAQSPRAAWPHYGLGLAELRSGRSAAGNAELATARALDKDIDMRAAKFSLAAQGTSPERAASAAPPAS